MMRARGFTLVEIAVVLAVVAVLAGIVMPSFLAQLQKSRRADAVTALMKLQFAQERHHALHGLYAADARQLVGARADRSEAGLYDIRLVEAIGDRYTAVAVARSDGAQASDGGCTRLTLSVQASVPEYGPDAACWNR